MSAYCKRCGLFCLPHRGGDRCEICHRESYRGAPLCQNATCNNYANTNYPGPQRFCNWCTKKKHGGAEHPVNVVVKFCALTMSQYWEIRNRWSTSVAQILDQGTDVAALVVSYLDSVDDCIRIFRDGYVWRNDHISV